MGRIGRWSAAIFGSLVAISVLGGTAIWDILGGAQRLTLEGEAPVVRPGAGAKTGPWRHYGGDPGGSHYQPLDAITPENVSRLTIAWTAHTGAYDDVREDVVRNASFNATPILVDGLLILCDPFNVVIALDPGSGEERWRHDPGVAKDIDPSNDYKCRGVAVFENGDAAAGDLCATRIFTGTADSRLVAVDARTGDRCMPFGADGAVSVAPSTDVWWPGEYHITSAPVVVDDTVIVGSAISDNGRVDAPRGTVHAFDAVTGAPRWAFDPIPRDPADPASASWDVPVTDRPGHANVWAPMSVDDARGLVFLPTSSPSPDFFGGLRPGDNRYANAVVALDADSGLVRWHFQIVHHDVWDYDTPAQPGLYRILHDGRLRDVVVQVTKQGFVFVLDRDTGRPVFPVAERAVPQQGVPGEALSPTQPFPTRTPSLVPDRIAPHEAFGVTLWDRLVCGLWFSRLRRDGLFTPPSTEGTLVYPFTGGGANWGGAAFDPERNLLVVPVSSVAHVITLIKNDPDATQPAGTSDPGGEFAPMQGAPYAMTRTIAASPLGLPCAPPPWGMLAAVDLGSGDIVWRRPLGTTEDIAPLGLALPFGTPVIGGPAVTAGGLTFQGGAMDNYLRAFETATGRELWKGRLPAGAQATPMTYEWDGRQYVVIASGGHGFLATEPGDAVVAFALPE